INGARIGTTSGHFTGHSVPWLNTSTAAIVAAPDAGTSTTSAMRIHVGISPRTMPNTSTIASNTNNPMAINTPNACDNAFPAASLDLIEMALATVANHSRTATPSSTVNDAVMAK